MAAQEIGALFVNLAMNTASFEAQLKQVSSQISGFGRRIELAMSTAAGGFKVLQAGLAGFGVIQAVTAVATWAKSMADAGEQADVLSKTIGVSIVQIAELEGMFQLTSGSIDGAASTMLRLNKAFADATTNEGDMRANFQALGISWQQLNATGGDTAKILELLAGRIDQYANDANKSAVLTKILGRNWAEISGVIGGGVEQFKKLREELARIDPNAAQAKEAGLQLDAALDRLFKSVVALKNDAFILLEPLLRSAAESMATFAQNCRLALGAVNSLLGPLGGLANTLSAVAMINVGVMTANAAMVLKGAGQLAAPPIDPNKTVAEVTFTGPPVPKVQPPPKGGGGKGGGGDRISQWRDELDTMLIAERKFFKDNKADELAFWQEKLKLTTDGSKEWLSVRKTIFDLEKALALKRRDDLIADAEHDSQINDEQFNRKKARIASLHTAEQLSNQEAIDAERALVEQKWALDLQYYERKKAAAEGDTDTLDKLNKKQALDYEKHLTTLEGFSQKKVETMYARLKSLTDDFAGVLGNAFSSAFDKISEGTFKLRDAIGSLLKDLGRMIANRAFKALLGGESGEGGGFGAGLLFKLATRLVGGIGGAALPANFGGPAGDFGHGDLTKYASGGSFRVGGAGAIDSKMIAFRASPGELVDITPASQRGYGGAEVIRIDLNPSEAFVSGIADQQIVTRSGTIIDLAVRQSTKNVRQNFAGMTAETQARQM